MLILHLGVMQKRLLRFPYGQGEGPTAILSSQYCPQKLEGNLFFAGILTTASYSSLMSFRDCSTMFRHIKSLIQFLAVSKRRKDVAAKPSDRSTLRHHVTRSAADLLMLVSSLYLQASGHKPQDSWTSAADHDSGPRSGIVALARKVRPAPTQQDLR